MSELLELSLGDVLELKRDLTKKGITSFDIDYELRLMVFVSSLIDGSPVTTGQDTFQRLVRQHMGWSFFYQQLLQGKIDKQTSYDMGQFRIAAEHIKFADVLYRTSLVTCLLQGDLTGDQIAFLKNVQERLLRSRGNLIEIANGKIGQHFSKELGEIAPTSSGTFSQDEDDKTLDEYLAELDNLVGLNSVKSEVKRLISFLQIQEKRKAHDLAQIPMSLHMVFTGNPGTGKTTVARLVARIYKALGVLKQGHLVETDRTGLVGQYVGHTAMKTADLVDTARNGVLFIDEAYSLAQGGETDFGQEAIDALVKRMEDYRDELIVIVAGYKDEMETFTEANPGLRSRFSTYINFNDYDPDELLQILDILCKKSEYNLTDEARSRAREVFSDATISAGNKFGNGRYVRNLFESTVRNQAMRLSTLPGDLDRESLSELRAVDLGR
jgi:stage V sporulation protein K